jgi:hypothetical protein
MSLIHAKLYNPKSFSLGKKPFYMVFFPIFCQEFKSAASIGLAAKDIKGFYTIL